MKQKLFVLLLCMVFICTLSLPVYADAVTTDSDGYSVLISDIPKVCPTCGSKLHAKWFSTSGAEVELSISDNGTIKIPAGSGVYAKITLYCTNCKYEKTEHRILGLDWGSEHPGEWNVEKAPTGIGRKDLPGYASDDGTPAVDSDGFPSSTFSMELNGADSPYGFSLKLPLYNTNYYDGSYFKQLTYGSFSTSGGNASCYSIQPSGNEVDENSLIVSYYFIAPFSGYYDFTTPSAKFYCILKDASGVSSNGSIYTRTNFTILPASTDFSKFSDSVVSKPSTKGGHFSPYVSDSVQYTRYLAKGEILYLNYYNYYHSDYGYNYPYKYLSIQTSTPTITGSNYECNIVSNDTLTINNNTWNGNIYVDNSNNLTYIYPQYTTINEKNETVTNISNTPIIYNSETKQYYTYDIVTNNYYYITYEQQPATPTPSPSPSPSPAPTETPAPSESPTPAPTPDPGTTPTPTPKPGGSISTPETGKPGGSSGSGQSWWEKLLDKLGSAFIDGLLGAISAVLKHIFKLLSTILGWIIWLVSQVLTLFPFLPPGLGALLIGGVVVCFVIGIIKFIRG